MLFIIAWRNIWRNKVRSAITAASVALGLWAGIFLMGSYHGIGIQRVELAIKNEVSHIQVHLPAFRKEAEVRFVIPSSDSVSAFLRSRPYVRAVSGRVVISGMVATTGSSNGIQVLGIDPAQEAAVTHLDAQRIEGRYLTGEGKNEALVGAKLASKMKLKVKSKIVITCTDKDNNLVSAAYRVVGIFTTDNALINERIVYTDRAGLAAMLGIATEVHEIAVLLKSNEQLEAARDDIAAHLPHLQVETWKDISPETSLIIQSTERYSVIYVILILLALTFGIVNTMLMAVLERRHELGMMLCLGMNRARMFMMVLVETIALVFVGSPVGFALGYGTIRSLETQGIDLGPVMGKTMESFGFTSVIYPRLELAQYTEITMLVIITALVAGLFPAVRAMRLKPVQAMNV